MLPETLGPKSQGELPGVLLLSKFPRPQKGLLLTSFVDDAWVASVVVGREQCFGSFVGWCFCWGFLLMLVGCFRWWWGGL